MAAGQARFDDVFLPMGLRVESVTLTHASAEISTKPVGLKLAQPAVITARVSELALAEFLERRAPGGLKGFHVEVRDGKVYVTATAKVVFEVQASAVCMLRIDQGARLFVDLESVDLMGVGAKTLVQQQLDQINPVLETADFPVPVTFTGVTAESGYVTLTGSALPPE